uniref:Uncharacterized protein n=1 Tax=Rhizophora mucronata TaxID=61149 RepID=A0A2P2NGU4_RHIMU
MFLLHNMAAVCNSLNPIPA